MKRTALHQLRLWRRNARPSCLATAVFLGLPTTCVIFAALWVIVTSWRTPSVQTRILIEADMHACSPGEAELPDGWQVSSVNSYDLYERVLPGRALGGIRIRFDPRGPQGNVAVLHEILFYRTSKEAASQFDRLPISYSSKYYRSWTDIDVTKANLSADEYRVVCAAFEPEGLSGSEDKVCHSRFRYGRFLSVFDAEIAPHDISMSEMIRALQAIDKRMLICAESYSE